MEKRTAVNVALGGSLLLAVVLFMAIHFKNKSNEDLFYPETLETDAGSGCLISDAPKEYIGENGEWTQVPEGHCLWPEGGLPESFRRIPKKFLAWLRQVMTTMERTRSLDGADWTFDVDDLDVDFYLWNKNSNTNLNGATVLGTSDFSDWDGIFDPSLPTKFFIHGYSSNVGTATGFVSKYIAQGFDYNLIGVNWESLAAVTNDIYLTPAKNIVPVGAHIARLIASLNQNLGVDLSDVHCIGHSLGAQTCGRVGRALSMYGIGTLGRISGLDPAGPLFVGDVLGDECLSKSDADFVDSHHTNGAFNRLFVARGYLGNLRPMGHVDFYYNGGKNQPGCSKPDYGGCSHSRVVYYFIESIGDPTAFEARLCTTSVDDCTVDANTDSGSANYAGHYAEKTDQDQLTTCSYSDAETAAYFVPVNSDSPYSQSR